MKFGKPLAIIVHYKVLINLECCKSSVLDMDSNTILKIKQKIQNTILMKFGKPLAIIIHYMVLINLECYKSSVLDMDSNTILKIKKISKDVLKVKLQKHLTYNPYEFW